SKKVGRILASPICALLLMGLVMFAWHVPKLYELALHSAAWHEVEHACFFIGAVVFWWPVVQPWPSRTQSPRWGMVPYLLLTDVQNTALSAVLAFSDRVLYSTYAVMPRLFGSASEDQAAAGAMMWVVGSLAFLLPAIAITVECLSTQASPLYPVQGRASRPAPPASPWSPLPRIPLIGSLPQSRLRGQALEATSFLVLFVVVGLCFAALASSDASDDDNLVLGFDGQSGRFLVTVFAQPGDLPAGHTNFGILVQDHNTQDVQLDATVDLTVVADGDTPSHASTARAVPGKAENKLLQTAELNLPNEGNWRMYVSVSHNSQSADFVLPLHVVTQQRAPEHLSLWPYTSLAAFGGILVMVYVQRHSGASASKAAFPRGDPTGKVGWAA